MPAKISSRGWARKITPTTSEDEADPDAGALQFLADDGIAQLRRPGLLDMAGRRLLVHGRAAGGGGGGGTGPRSAWSEVPARPPRRAVNQLIGFQ